MQIDDIILEDLISLEEASKLSGLSNAHLRRLVESNALWGKKIGRNWITSKSEVLKYILKDHRPGRKPKKA